MSLTIANVKNSGDLQKERVVLKVNSDINIGNYILFCCVSENDNTVESGDVYGAYWIDDKQVKSGDLIIIYTKVGKSSEKTNQDDTKSHFFYWGKSEPLWTSGRRSVLITSSSYQFGPR